MDGGDARFAIEQRLNGKTNMITTFTKSDEYRKAIHDLIPGGAHTYSKGDDQFPALSPAAIARGKGAYVWDLDGNRYLDCPMGLSSVNLGHAYEPVLVRVREELEKGVNFQRPSYIEREMAEAFLGLVPGHDMIKFAKNGSTATTAAIKLARAYTGRPMVAIPTDHPFYSYDDWFIGKTACTRGVPDSVTELSVAFDSRDLKTLEDAFAKYPGRIACVISEPERIVPMAENYLPEILRIAHANGALFVQDEMVTGYKTGFPGTMATSGVVPDLATWGKGIANGFSFCALTGKREIMELGGIRQTGQEKVFLISTTHGGETHAIGAALATLEVMKSQNVLSHNHAIGQFFIEEVGKVIQAAKLGDFVSQIGQKWMPGFVFKDRDGKPSDGMRTLVMQELIKRGVLFQAIFVPCFSHTRDDVKLFAQAFDEALKVYADALESGYERFLVGPPARPVFRKHL